MKTFLKTKEVEMDGEKITITQLSGLDRFEFLDYCTDLTKPQQPVRPADDASQQEQDAFLEDMGKCLKQWGRVNFIGQARLVAYGYMVEDEESELDDRHQTIMASMTPEQVKFLHDEIATFSGIPLPEPVDENTDTSTEQPTEEQTEPVDPKG